MSKSFWLTYRAEWLKIVLQRSGQYNALSRKRYNLNIVVSAPKLLSDKLPSIITPSGNVPFIVNLPV
tara:strand:- start:280 stop:480 length:201 start_codon:yes stop_codon:yes gene_type:complete